jgi:predicted N-acetyltransferase YhbS
MKIDIRPETDKDYRAIYNLTMRTFGRQNEAKLIDALRKTEQFNPALSLTAKYRQQIVGHILFYPISIVDGDKKIETLALAPMSVLSEYQRKGIGSKLVKVGLGKAKKEGFTSVIVVGHPHFYSRFGFSPASTWGIKSPFKVPNESFMGIELAPNALKDAQGTVRYPKAFDNV